MGGQVGKGLLVRRGDINLKKSTCWLHSLALGAWFVLKRLLSRGGAGVDFSSTGSLMTGMRIC